MTVFFCSEIQLSRNNQHIETGFGCAVVTHIVVMCPVNAQGNAWRDMPVRTCAIQEFLGGSTGAIRCRVGRLRRNFQRRLWLNAVKPNINTSQPYRVVGLRYAQHQPTRAQLTVLLRSAALALAAYPTRSTSLASAACCSAPTSIYMAPW